MLLQQLGYELALYATARFLDLLETPRTMILHVAHVVEQTVNLLWALSITPGTLRLVHSACSRLLAWKWW